MKKNIFITVIREPDFSNAYLIYMQASSFFFKFKKAFCGTVNLFQKK